MLSFLDLNIPGHVEGHLSSRQLVVLRFALTAASAGRCRLSGGLGGAGLPAAPPPAWFGPQEERSDSSCPEEQLCGSAGPAGASPDPQAELLSNLQTVNNFLLGFKIRRSLSF